MSTAQSARRPRIFYGWWIAISFFFINFYWSGVMGSGFTAFFNPWKESFGLSSATTSLAFSMQQGMAGCRIGDSGPAVRPHRRSGSHVPGYGPGGGGDVAAVRQPVGMELLPRLCDLIGRVDDIFRRHWPRSCCDLVPQASGQGEWGAPGRLKRGRADCATPSVAHRRL